MIKRSWLNTWTVFQGSNQSRPSIDRWPGGRLQPPLGTHSFLPADSRRRQQRTVVDMSSITNSVARRTEGEFAVAEEASRWCGHGPGQWRAHPSFKGRIRALPRADEGEMWGADMKRAYQCIAWRYPIRGSVRYPDEASSPASNWPKAPSALWTMNDRGSFPQSLSPRFLLLLSATSTHRFTGVAKGCEVRATWGRTRGPSAFEAATRWSCGYRDCRAAQQPELGSGGS
jgi:hypothetical protein